MTELSTKNTMPMQYNATPSSLRHAKIIYNSQTEGYILHLNPYICLNIILERTNNRFKPLKFFTDLKKLTSKISSFPTK